MEEKCNVKWLCQGPLNCYRLPCHWTSLEIFFFFNNFVFSTVEKSRTRKIPHCFLFLSHRLKRLKECKILHSKSENVLEGVAQ